MLTRAWSSADYDVALPEGHRFPARKYRMIRDAVVARGILMRKEVPAPERCPRGDLARVHTAQYLDAMEQGTLTGPEQRRLGFPWSEGLLERSTRTVQATLAGGTHHAFPDHGEGFCCFNDVAVATRVLRTSHSGLRTAVLDLDVHQGNGTAAIFADDPDTFTFSMHGAKNFPFKKERSSRDVELDDGTGDREYLALLDRHIDEVLDEARADLVFYLAGSDPYAGDLADIAEIHATSVHELRVACG